MAVMAIAAHCETALVVHRPGVATTFMVRILPFEPLDCALQDLAGSV